MRQRRGRCTACKRLFTPDPRVAKRQRTCSKEACQRRRHAAAQADWILRHPGYFRDRGAKHRAYREEVKDGVRVPKRKAKSPDPRAVDGDHGEQDEISTQGTQQERLAPTLAGGREQDEILTQVVFLLTFAVRLLLGGEPASKTTFETPGVAWSSP